jgi:hypothetical protein
MLVQGVFPLILSSIAHASRGCIKGFHGILAKTQVKMLKKYRVLNGKVWASDDEFIKMIP